MELKLQALTGIGLQISKISGAGLQATHVGFESALTRALDQTNALQKEAGRLGKEFTLENPTVSLEETMLAGMKSNIAFQTTLQVRNRMVQAYTDIMNMQV